ncbi:MAG: DinB family protein [Spirosomataceae bacterium]
MKKSAINPMPEYFDRYINQTDDVTVSEALQISLNELDAFPLAQWEALGDRVYAPDKWTIQDILQHLIDTERIFAYRALCFARGEQTPLPSYDENEYAHQANAQHRTLTDLIAELRLVRQSSIALYQSFTSEMLLRTGLSFKGHYSVLAIGFILAGHQRWHQGIIQERYLSLLG